VLRALFLSSSNYNITSAASSASSAAAAAAAAAPTTNTTTTTTTTATALHENLEREKKQLEAQPALSNHMRIGIVGRVGLFVAWLQMERPRMLSECYVILMSKQVSKQRKKERRRIGGRRRRRRRRS
jgi:predicted amino acid dehydrogenase